MKVSYKWLEQYIDLTGITPEQLADKLTNSGVAVDVVEKRNKGIEKVVVGYVLERENHPDAEKLNLCKVDVGVGEPLQIICGAANVDKGQKVPVALVGAELPGDVKIKRAKLRGIDSEGMICSAKELGMNEKLLPKGKAEGILVLPETSNIGDEIEPLLGFDDYVLELDLTPNRADCLSMLGVAYEVAAILDREIRLPEIPLENTIDKSQRVKVQIEAKAACPHYASRLLTNIKVAESPQWLQNKLIAAGIRPINNVVDVTNYVLLEYGQPLHAFDFERLEQPNILVRMAKKGETVVTLDDQERTLDEEMLLITDGIKPIAIAGVMGAANSEVSEKTTQVLLESAYFKGQSIRKTSKKLGLRSEASLRFEKGVDPSKIYSALNRAAQLLQEVAGAELVGDIYEEIVEVTKEQEIFTTPAGINKLLGTNISSSDLVSIFKKLNFVVTEQTNGLLVKVPTRRADITIEADLVEEIARIYGYDNIPITLPSGLYVQGGLTPKQKFRRKIKEFLDATGLKEVITYTFNGEKQQNVINGLTNESKPIPLAMPLSEERQFLRTQILPQLLEVAQYNLNRRISNIRIYEVGATFLSDERNLTKLPEEKWLISGLVTGSFEENWQKTTSKIDFYYLKGIIEDLIKELGINNVKYEAVAINGYHPGRTAKITINETILGYFGQLHPEVQAAYDLKETYAFELDLNKLYTHYEAEIDYIALPKYPAIQRDIALVIDRGLEVNNLVETIKASTGNLLEDLTIFDVYLGEQVGREKKSIAISLTFRSNERTLTDEEVNGLYDKVLVKLKDEHNAELRK